MDEKREETTYFKDEKRNRPRKTRPTVLGKGSNHDSEGYASEFFYFHFSCFGLLALSAQQEKGDSPEKISSLGKYQGYSKPICTEWVRTSLYVPARDGTRLAVDILRPSIGGKAISDPFPVIWTDNRYHRVMYSPAGKLITILDQMPWLKTILQHGYVIASVDIRGSGASFGWLKGSFTPEEAQDGYDITEWFAAQPWCREDRHVRHLLSRHHAIHDRKHCPAASPGHHAGHGHV